MPLRPFDKLGCFSQLDLIWNGFVCVSLGNVIHHFGTEGGEKMEKIPGDLFGKVLVR